MCIVSIWRHKRLDTRMRRIAFGYSLISFLLGASSLAFAEPDLNQIQSTIVADTTAIKPGEPFQVGVLMKISPHWHVYWMNPGDAGIPTTVELKLPPGFKASPMQYPVPTRIVQPGDIVAYGYEDEVMFIMMIMPPAKIDAANITIEANANWLVCEKVCIPGNAKLSLALPVAETAKPDHTDLFNKWSGRMPHAVNNSADVAAHSVKVSDKHLTISIDWIGPPPKSCNGFRP